MLNLRSICVAALVLAAAAAPSAYAVSASKAFTVTNTGNAALTVSGAAISGNTAEYALTGNTCSAVAPGGSCAMTVRFTPSVVGQRAAAALNFSSDGANGPSHSIALSGAGGYPSSCKILLDAVPGAPSGNYTIDPDGAGAVAPFSAYCDMTSSGGGWTRVARQYEGYPIAWTGSAWGNSFTLAQAKIPAHTQVGFGADNSATAVDYINFQYTTGNIAKTLVTGLKSGAAYHIHRGLEAHHSYHDPDDTLYLGSNIWSNTLTFDRAGLRAHDWAFSPSNPTPGEQGYALVVYRAGVADTMAWTVWVR